MQQNMMVTLLGAVASLLIFIEPAYAYLDPGTGSILLQALIAAIAGVMVTGGVFWSRIKDMFSRKKGGNNQQQNEDKIDD